jgi:hypothetical protein
MRANPRASRPYENDDYTLARSTTEQSFVRYFKSEPITIGLDACCDHALQMIEVFFDLLDVGD